MPSSVLGPGLLSPTPTVGLEFKFGLEEIGLEEIGLEDEANDFCVLFPPGLGVEPFCFERGLPVGGTAVGAIEPAFDGCAVRVWEVFALGREPKAEPDDDPGLRVSSLVIGRTEIPFTGEAVELCPDFVLLPPFSEKAGPALFGLGIDGGRVLFARLLPTLLGGVLALVLGETGLDETGLGDNEKPAPELRLVGLNPAPPDEAGLFGVEPAN